MRRFFKDLELFLMTNAFAFGPGFRNGKTKEELNLLSTLAIVLGLLFIIVSLLYKKKLDKVLKDKLYKEFKTDFKEDVKTEEPDSQPDTTIT